ncbi:ribosomal protein L21-like protein [Pterulicium gracile]|uniref:Large ribosomal subunit protein bL21m n=1 Tax=Pterulicium gracile TaxID=1884261 RepID=A0A5C3QIL9_9AGAR|nr:ribosomal protein L21-like protein [Pterula gracilis]
MFPTCVRQLLTRSLHTAASSPTEALNLLRSQPDHYIIANIVGRKYLLAPRDVLTVPRLRDVQVGDVLKLSDISEVGSREYTLRGDPYLPAEQIGANATVIEHTKGSFERIFKKKRRKGYAKTKTHKQTYTRLRVGEFSLPTGVVGL